MVDVQKAVITGCILARNDAGRIKDALQSLQGWTEQIIVIDRGSEDSTAEIAQRYAEVIPVSCSASPFDALHELAAEAARGDWIFYLGANERVPPALGAALRRLIAERGSEFAAVCIPFKHYFCGKWIEHGGWWPGYTRPQLLKKGAFRFLPRLQSGLEVHGATFRFPADDPGLAIVHYAYDTIQDYLDRLNAYTESEAERLDTDGASHAWEAMLAHFVQDWQSTYEHKRADLDGMHGFVIAFLSAFSQFSARAKLWDRRTRRGEGDASTPLPTSVPEMLEFMAHVCREGAGSWLADSRSSGTVATGREMLVYEAAVTGAGAESASRLLRALAVIEEGVAVGMQEGSHEAFPLPEQVRRVAAGTPAIVRITEAVSGKFRPWVEACVNVARAEFPTDRLPGEWAATLSVADRVWVSSEFNRGTFVRGGVARDKIAVIPEILDPALFTAGAAPSGPSDTEAFTFLAYMDWGHVCGWDILLEAFASAFSPNENIHLRVQVAPSAQFAPQEIHSQADAWMQARTGRTLEETPHIHLHHERLSIDGRLCLYRQVQAAVFPSRGDGAGRRLLEAMAAGLPTVATAWASAAEFHNRQVGFPLQYRIAPVAEVAVREQPQYTGHWWAEPSLQDLQRQLRAIVARRDEAQARGQAAREAVRSRFSQAAVTSLLTEEMARCRDLASQRTSSIPQRTAPEGPPPTSPTRPAPNPVVLDLPAPVDFRASMGRKLRLLWRTEQPEDGAMAILRHEFVPQLKASGDIELVLKPDEAGGAESFEDHARRHLAALEETSPDVTILDHFPTEERYPPTGKLIVWPCHDELLRYIDGGMSLPSGRFDEVWTPTRWVRDAYVRHGIPAEKVRLVPRGVRTDIFTPGGPPYEIETGKATRFLFVGPLLPRTGADLLLQAYLETFRREDDVCLIVSETGVGDPETEILRVAYWRAQADPMAPVIIMAPVDLDEGDLASLYRASTCVVCPCRNDPVATSILQGMACGLPVIVTAGGAAEDYLDDTMGLRVPSYRGHSRRIGEVPPAPSTRQQAREPDFEALRQALRWVAQYPQEARARGEAGHSHVLKGWTWDRSAAMARERLLALAAPPSVRPAIPAKRWIPPRNGSGIPSKKSPPRRSPKKIELSFCLIARNEEARIRYCLESIAPYVDEMIVVDTGSADQTREIARDCGARVFDFPWTESFADARNQSMAQARGEWIFWMDADDVIPPECGAQLRALIRQNPAKDTAYQVQVRIPPGPTEFSASVVDHVKLFPNRPDLRFEHRIHEQILPALRHAGIRIVFSDAFVIHQHYDRTDTGQAQKRRRDFRLLELDLAEHPDHPFVLFNLGMTYLYATKEFEVAAQYLQRSLDITDWRTSIVRKAYALLTTARICQQDWQAAVRANEQGRGHYPDDAELLFQAGQIYGNLRRYGEARTAFERLVNGREDPHYRSVDVGLRTYRGLHELALLHRQGGDAQSCVRLLQEVTERYPEYLPAQLDLVDTLHGLKQDALARVHLTAIPRLEGIAPQLRTLYARAGVTWPTEEVV